MSRTERKWVPHPCRLLLATGWGCSLTDQKGPTLSLREKGRVPEDLAQAKVLHKSRVSLDLLFIDTQLLADDSAQHGKYIFVLDPRQFSFGSLRSIRRNKSG